MDSPFIKGLVALIPLLLLMIMGGLGLMSSSERKLVMKAGSIPASPLAHFELAETAAKQGDYVLAEDEYFKGLALAENSATVLGVNSYLEDLIYPERKIRAEIELLEGIKAEVISREVHARLAVLYDSIGEKEKMRAEIEMAEAIDPNDEQTKQIQTLK